MTSVTFRGLDIDGDVEIDPGDYMTPPTCAVSIDSITIDDADAFHSCTLYYDETSLSLGAIAMLEARDRLIGGKLHPRIEEIVRTAWWDDICEALIAQES